MKRNVITIALVAGALWAHAQSKPNIVFILADDQRHDELGCAGALVEKDDQVLVALVPCARGGSWIDLWGASGREYQKADPYEMRHFPRNDGNAKTWAKLEKALDEWFPESHRRNQK